MPKIAISGSSGFIGSQLKDRFKGESIPRNSLYCSNLDNLLEGVDTVIHCASYGNMSWHEGNEEIFDANVMSTFNILESCKRMEVKNFIFLGSSSEYGEKKEPMKEEMLPEAKTLYGCTKVCGTYLTRHYSQYLNTVTIRPFSVYGENEDSRRFIPTLVDSVLKDKHFTLYNGNHDWIHISDFVDAIAIVLKYMTVLNGLVINVGTGREISNDEVVQTLQTISGKAPVMSIAPKKVQDSNRWVADNSKIKSLGWKQHISLYEGIKRVYDYRRANYLSQQEAGTVASFKQPDRIYSH
jgi:nucleoside-diphosphate-sugar epimerase